MKLAQQGYLSLTFVLITEEEYNKSVCPFYFFRLGLYLILKAIVGLQLGFTDASIDICDISLG